MKNAVISSLIVIAFGTGCTKSENIIGLNENIHHDDFNYRVTAVEKRKSIDADSAHMIAGGTFYIVTFEVENDAMRVGHIWNNQIAYVISDKGDKYDNNEAVQRLLDAKEHFGWQSTYNTGHGSTEQTKLVFDIPGNPAGLYLKIHGETLMGDVFNLNRFKRIKVKLN
jgi:hypothetical protein